MENSTQQQQNACAAAYQGYWQQQAQNVAKQQLANQLTQASRRLEPGITWERTRGNRHRVVIRVVIRREAVTPQLGIGLGNLLGPWM